MELKYDIFFLYLLVYSHPKTGKTKMRNVDKEKK